MNTLVLLMLLLLIMFMCPLKMFSICLNLVIIFVIYPNSKKENLHCLILLNILPIIFLPKNIFKLDINIMMAVIIGVILLMYSYIGIKMLPKMMNNMMILHLVLPPVAQVVPPKFSIFPAQLYSRWSPNL